MAELKEQQYKDSTKFNTRIYLHQKFGTNKYPMTIWIFDNINKLKNARVLELGCGNGLLWKINAKRIPENWEIVLSDFSEGMLKDAKENIGNNIKNIKYELINAENIPYENNTFDIIIANNMLYHIPNRKKALSEIYRVLKKNGNFYATTGRKDNMKEIKVLIKEYYSLLSDRDSSPSLFENFSLENGENQLKEYFDEVLLKIYKNQLKVNEAKPIVEYVISLNYLINGRIILDENKRDSFTEFIQEKINRTGDIYISSDFGIFICKKTN